jgi:hypothetical protein
MKEMFTGAVVGLWKAAHLFFWQATYNASTHSQGGSFH